MDRWACLTIAMPSHLSFRQGSRRMLLSLLETREVCSLVQSHSLWHTMEVEWGQTPAPLFEVCTKRPVGHWTPCCAAMPPLRTHHSEAVRETEIYININIYIYIIIYWYIYLLIYKYFYVYIYISISKTFFNVVVQCHKNAIYKLRLVGPWCAPTGDCKLGISPSVIRAQWNLTKA